MAELSTAASALGPLALPHARNADFTGKATTVTAPGATRLYQLATPFAGHGEFAGKSQNAPSGISARATRNPMLASAGRLMTRR